MTELSCGVARDLLPLYADNLTGEESCALVEAHLQACEACQTELESLRAGLPKQAPQASKSLRRVKGKLKKKRVLTAILATMAGLALLFGLFVYGQIYHPPLHYKEDMIRVGRYNWDANEFIETGNDWYVMNKYNGNKCNRIVDYTRTVWHENADGSQQLWVFVNYKKDALWDRLFLKHGDYPEGAWISGTSIYQETTWDVDKIHATVYWMDHIEKLGSMQIVERETDHLSQEVLDLCTLIWDGDIK